MVRYGRYKEIFWQGKMSMLKAELIDKTGTVVAVVRQTENYN